MDLRRRYGTADSIGQKRWHVLGGVATCSEGFVTCFLKVILACLISMAAAVQPNSLGTIRKQFSKPSEQVAAPPGKNPHSLKSCITAL